MPNDIKVHSWIGWIIFKKSSMWHKTIGQLINQWSFLLDIDEKGKLFIDLSFK